MKFIADRAFAQPYEPIKGEGTFAIVSFDTQLMQNDEIAGEQYQQGDLPAWQLRSYVFQRDGRVCAYCGRKNAERCELDHIVPKSTGGTDRVSNLVAACRDRNASKGNLPVEEFLVGQPERLAAIRNTQSTGYCEDMAP